MEREECFKLLSQYIKNPNMIKHSLASEVVLSALAEKFSEDKNKWALAGLLHDIDVEITEANPKIHGQKAAEILRQSGIDGEIIDAIVRHNEEATELKRETSLHFALSSGETITGLITATTLVYPDKKLSSVKPKSIVKRMKEKAFATSVKRETIMECEKIRLKIDEFAELALKAMQSISDKLEL